MIDVAEALLRLEAAVEPLEIEEVALDDAWGRALAADVCADRDFPPADRSAMDGYAVRSADVPRAGGWLKVTGEISAGQPAGATRVGPEQAVRIMTGAIVPPGADAVIEVERAREEPSGGRVWIAEPPAPGRHIRRRGEDLRAGTVALRAGDGIGAAEIAALAAVGCSRVRVFRRPDVRVLATGDEIVEPERAPADHQLRNSNAFALLAQLRELGLRGRYLGIAADDRPALDRLLEPALGGDVLLVSGGVSAGARDLVGPALDAHGFERLFHKVAMRPGKPLLAGRRGRCLVFGLPGNPLSTFTCFTVFGAPMLRRLMGHRRWRSAELPATLAAPLRANPGLRTYHLARIEAGGQGLVAAAVRTAGSGDVLALARANGFIVTGPEAGDLPAGAPVGAVPWPGCRLAGS
jgi:molybdopterin molybdotransferase